jgi:hypothetical protein
MAAALKTLAQDSLVLHPASNTPPVILPTNPGMQITPPPVFQPNTINKQLVNKPVDKPLIDKPVNKPLVDKEVMQIGNGK